MSDRIAVMSEGRVLQVGSPTEIYDSPTSRFVAGFIGTCNLLDGVRTEDPNRLLLPGVGEVEVGDAGHGRAGERVTLAVRPERIRMTTGEAPADARVSVAGVLTERVFLGDDWVYRVVVDSGATITVSIPSGSASELLARTADGERVGLTWDPAAARVLPAEEAAA